MTRLPSSIDDLRGRRAARWIRESTEGQFDRYGPASQREQQDRSIERYGLLDTGLVYQVAVSGKIAWRSPAMARMLEDVRARAFDVLVVGYSDRWQRNLRRTLEILEDEIHPAGAAVLFADRRILSSDSNDWDELVAEATSAERYIRRLAGRITDGYAAKFRTLADQAGNAPLGFRRSPEPPHVLEVDPSSIGRAVAVFERYAAGSLSMRELAAASGLEYERVVKILRNPLYNGWVRRHRGVDEERRPAPWRAVPPVSDDLWRRCADLRERRRRGGGPSPRRETDILRGLVECAACGRPIRGAGTMGQGRSARRARAHPVPCDAWGPRSKAAAELWEGPISEQLAGVVLDDATIARIRAVLAAPSAQPIDTTKARIERQLRDLALEVADGRIDDHAYLERVAVLRAEAKAAGEARPPRVDPDAAVERIRELGKAWSRANDVERSELVHAIYARIPVVRERFGDVVLTPAAYEIGLDQAMPELVRVNWRPRQEPGPQVHTVKVPIAGRRERWAARRTA